MRRQALDRERAGDTDARIVGIRLVVEILELGLGVDRGVDLLLARDPRRPPFGMKPGRLLGPGVPRRIRQSVGRIVPPERGVDRGDRLFDLLRIVIALRKGPQLGGISRPRVARLARDLPIPPRTCRGRR
jgi:hypothetical protein